MMVDLNILVLEPSKRFKKRHKGSLIGIGQIYYNFFTELHLLCMTIYKYRKNKLKIASESEEINYWCIEIIDLLLDY